MNQRTDRPMNRPEEKIQDPKLERDRAMELTEQVAEQSEAWTSNGNRMGPTDGKIGDAQHGGPGIEKARERQPPHATRPHED